MERDLVVNRRARKDYQILKTLEAGIVLLGSEVKSLKAGKGSLEGAFARVENGEAFLYQMNISPYEKAASYALRDPKAPRKLLLHKKEIGELAGAISRQGRTIVPLKLYFRRGKIKVLLGIASGRSKVDKREKIKEQETQREISRVLKRRREF
ncbi:SsrA-binding protein SmpB [Candidatus Methylacidiphilum infernorum]|uniref:SsrA-binding protein n=1 Tax=Methylacidiphilum infernorum (isolate V4) TaxID=481448 RepID=B3DV24_METI4|nr:SsrA-binding protein SmpB [Candidatus Methylacidiphilum infernorum]ACD83177.1 tmRNA-binding protein [Methylacidiphilum infernorum V4]